MKKRIIFGILAVIIGIGIALFSESFFREIIQDVFKWSTSDNIKFVGKNMYIFSSKLYYITFGIVSLILTLENLNQKLTKVLKSGIICLLIFGILLIGISAIDANMKVVQCTACDDGIRKLHWNGINYGLILGASAIISIIPSFIRIIKRRKKPAYNTVYN
ncbi:hypothetical protein F0365_13885 [Nonlabens sp. Ci31]|uniref:L-rhamnose/proton symporter RhaT n=1 Tax=Nonlabens sp. Ci31 TaxID=2608253 RepID=UPI0014639BD4|nr:L-rhamnose/proton symporter RhaT [Nonlabens sp. Ci31]QJP35411.1 hypothetical protein F0365_13885 [Nonlabens sp. Ci31]